MKNILTIRGIGLSSSTIEQERKNEIIIGENIANYSIGMSDKRE